MKKKDKTHRLNVRLLKEGANIQIAFRKEDHGLAERQWPPCKGARLFVGTAHEGIPQWKAFLEEEAGDLGPLWNKGSAALLFVPIKKRWMVVSFGPAHYFIDPAKIERDFGLKVVLNTVEPKKLKSLDARTPEEVTTTRRIQTSKQSEFSAFGIDIERDIVRTVTGSPKNEKFGSEVTGADSLIIRCKVKPADVHKKCVDLLGAYRKDDYKADFGWIDHIKTVRDADLLTALDEALVVAIKMAKDGPAPDAMHLAPPDLIDWSRFGQIKYTGFRSREAYPRLDINDFLAELADRDPAFDVEKFKAGFYVSRDENETGNFYKAWKLHDCFVYETDYDGERYVLSGGQWFAVDKVFAREIDKFFKAIPQGREFPSASQNDNEQTYNPALSEKIAGLAILDTKTAKGKEWTSGIEPCDFFSNDREFIHIKNEASSSKLSHLFNQGVVSAEAFLRDERFRAEMKMLAAKVDEAIANRLGDPTQRPATNDFTVLYGVMRRPYANGAYDLPFFSKVSLRNAIRVLDGFGYRFAFSWIKKVLNAADNNAEAAA